MGTHASPAVWPQLPTQPQSYQSLMVWCIFLFSFKNENIILPLYISLHLGYAVSLDCDLFNTSTFFTVFSLLVRMKLISFLLSPFRLFHVHFLLVLQSKNVFIIFKLFLSANPMSMSPLSFRLFIPKIPKCCHSNTFPDLCIKVTDYERILSLCNAIDGSTSS